MAKRIGDWPQVADRPLHFHSELHCFLDKLHALRPPTVFVAGLARLGSAADRRE